MPRKNKHKRLLWEENTLRKAVFAVLVNNQSIKKSAVANGIPFETLRRHIIKARAGQGVEKKCGRPTILTTEQEKELSDILKQTAASLYGLTPRDTQRLVFDFCEKRKIKNNFNKKSCAAGRYWLEGFLSRHRSLSVKQAEATSIQRAIGFNRAKVNKFFEILKSILFKDDHIQVPPSNIFNVDESGFTICQKVGRVIAARGRSVGQLTSAEKGKTVTAVCAVSATGVFVPPMIIFPRGRMKPSLLDRAPPGSVGAANKSGWINEGLFADWFDHFLKSVQPNSRPEPVLLLMDGHSSHTQNIAVIDKARANNVKLLVFPSHCTHKLQPLDVSFFKSLNTFYNSELQTWLRNHPARGVTENEIPELLANAYGRAATVKNGISGFAATGIYPFNDAIFTDEDYAACDALSKPAPTENEVPVLVGIDPSSSFGTVADLESGADVGTVVEMQGGADVGTVADLESGADVGISAVDPCIDANNVVPVIDGDISFANLVNLPMSPIICDRVGVGCRPKKRKAGHAFVVTESPYKKQLCESKNEKIAKAVKLGERKEKAKERKLEKEVAKRMKERSNECGKKKERMSLDGLVKKGVAKRLVLPTELKSAAGSTQKSRKKNFGNSTTSKSACQSAAEKSQNDFYCLICSEKFQDPPIEPWIQCDKCLGWCHEACSAGESSMGFTCDLCK